MEKYRTNNTEDITKKHVGAGFYDSASLLFLKRKEIKIKITIEVDDKIYKPALEWHQIEQANPLPETKIRPQSADSEWVAAYNKRMELWKKFLTKHKLLVKQRTERFMGAKIPVTEIKNKDEFFKALTLIRYTL